MTARYELHPMIGMSLIEQEEWFNDRIQDIFDIPATNEPHRFNRVGRYPDHNVIHLSFKPRGPRGPRLPKN